MSATVSIPSQPISAHTLRGSGSVTTMEEFIGSQSRWKRRRPAVNPSVARRTYRQRTTPRVLTAVPALISVTGVSSYSRTPRASTARARPRTSFAGCSRAQWGWYRPPRAPATATRSAVAPASSSRAPASGHCFSSSAQEYSRASWAGFRATFSSPPLTMSASMPSAAAVAITSSTVSFSSSWNRPVTVRPWLRTYWLRPPVMLLVSQPPLRPEAP